MPGASDSSQANSYNWLNERMGATSGAVTRSFIYDPDGRLMENMMAPHEPWEIG